MDLQLNTHIDISKVNAGLEDLSGTLRRAVERGLTRATVLLRNAVQTNIRSPYGDKPPAVAFGALADGVTGEVYEENKKQVGRVFLQPPVDRYGLFVELGTRPHRPPLYALYPWVQVKFGLTDLQEIRAAAWGVADAIAKRGTRGHFMFQRALDEHERDVLAILQEEITRSLAELN